MSDEESKKDDPNRQDMSVFDAPNPALAPTWEAQMSRLERVVVPPPSYTDPSNPSAASGSVNMAVETHPSDISEDYGADVDPGEDEVQSPIDIHSLEMKQVVTGEIDGGGAVANEFPEDREDWQKKDWRARAEELNLAVSGNMDTLKDRVEEHEALVEEYKGFSAAEWKDEIDKCETGEDLASLRQLYEQSETSLVSVDEAFDAKQAELDNA